MQKFKIQREYVTKKILEMVGNLKGGDLLPDYIELEGELLEGGMVGKCCETCLYRAHTSCALCECHKVEKRCSNPDCIGCHNKKEEGYKWLDIKIEAKGKDFNRETPKEDKSCKNWPHTSNYCLACTPKEELKKMLFPQFVALKEEVKLPEMLDINEKITPDPIVYAYKNRTKIVEILTYLASKEAGDNRTLH